MTVQVYFVDGHKASDETVLHVRRVWEWSNNVGTFYYIEQESGVITDIWKKYVKQLIVTA